MLFNSSRRPRAMWAMLLINRSACALVDRSRRCLVASVQSALHRFTKLHLDLLESIVREGAEPGQFQIQDQRPRDVAMQILAGAQGALMIRRLTGDAHVIDAVTAEFRSYLGYVPTK